MKLGPVISPTAGYHPFYHLMRSERDYLVYNKGAERTLMFSRDSLSHLYVTEHFSVYELLGNCFCKEEVPEWTHPLNRVDHSYLENAIKLCHYVLEPARELIGGPIDVNSFIRSEARNRSVGGVPTSNHLTGRAADVRPYYGCPLGDLMVALRTVLNRLVSDGSIRNFELILYPSFIHVAI